MKTRLPLLMPVLLHCATAQADLNVVDDSTSGSVLIIPNVEVRWDANGNLIQDVFVSLTNLDASVDVHVIYVQGDPPLNEPGVRLHPGWNTVNQRISVGFDQPVYWSVHDGAALSVSSPVTLQPWSVLDLPPSPGDHEGRPDPQRPGERMLRGYMVLIAVDPTTGVEIRWNHLMADVLTINYQNGTAHQQRAWSIAAGTFVADGAPTATLGVLVFDGTEYERIYDELLIEFAAAGNATLFDSIPVNVDSDLTLLPVTMDLTTGSSGPTRTKAKFQVYNENGFHFTGTQKCLSSWDQTLLSNYPLPNIFTRAALQTDTGKARIDGVADSSCAQPNLATPLLGSISKIVQFDSPPRRTESSQLMAGAGSQNAVIFYSGLPARGASAPPAEGDPPSGGLRDDNSEDQPKTSNEGSLLVLPSIELKWDGNGSLAQDTVIQVGNDSSASVRVLYAMVNGDPPDAGPPAHPGYNRIVCTAELGPHQTASWSAANDSLGNACPAFAALDPGPPPGRTLADDPGNTTVRGYMLLWAIDAQGNEIFWNHLHATATQIHYADRTMWDYPATAFRALTKGSLSPGDPTGTPGTLNLNGVEFEIPFTFLESNFYSAGAHDGLGSGVLTDAQFTLLPLDMDVLHPAVDYVTTYAKFDVWNMNQIPFSGLARCVPCWEQSLASGLSTPPNHLLYISNQTPCGRARVQGAGNFSCDSTTTVATPMIGLWKTVLKFSGQPVHAGTPMIGSGAPLAAAIVVPTYADCNANDIADDQDLLAGVDVDCNSNGLLDACESVGLFDGNGDGLTTSADYAGFPTCMTGPDMLVNDVLGGCADICAAIFDGDGDADIDLKDSLLLQAAIGQ